MRFGLLALVTSGVFNAALWSADGAQVSSLRRGTALVIGQVVDAATNKGIRDAIVSLDGGRSVMTTRDGRFVFRGVAAGSRWITASKFGYLNGDAGVGRLGAQRIPLRINDGERRGDVVVRLWKNGAVSGMVVDEAGEPLVGIRVFAIRREMVAGRLPLTFQGGSTDDRGIYRISRLPPGTYLIAMLSSQVSVPTTMIRQYEDERGSLAGSGPNGLLESLSRLGIFAGNGTADAREVGDFWQPMPKDAPTPPPSDDSRVLTYPAQFFPATRSAAAATMVTLGPSRELTGIDLHVNPLPTVRLSGVLIGPSGPAPHLSVRLIAKGAEALGPIADAAQTISDPNGAFTFAAVPAGDYSVQVDSPSPAGPPARVASRAAGVSAAADVDPNAGLWANIPVTLGDEDVLDFDVVLRRNVRVSGRLVFDGSLAALSPQTMPLVPVYLQPLNGSGASLAASVDSHGEFVLPSVGGGRYLLRVPTELAGWVLKSAMLGGRDFADLPLELGESDVSDLLVTFIDRPSSISGTVQMFGRRRDDAAVIAFPADAELRASLSGDSPRLRALDLPDSGIYKLSNLPAGAYYIAAVAGVNVDWSDPALLDRLSSNATYLRIGEGENATCNLRLREIDK